MIVSVCFPWFLTGCIWAHKQESYDDEEGESQFSEEEGESQYTEEEGESQYTEEEGESRYSDEEGESQYSDEYDDEVSIALQHLESNVGFHVC